MKRDDTNAISITSRHFGILPDGSEARLFIIESSELRLSVSTFGARVVSLLSKDAAGQFGDICLGFNSAVDYTTGSNAFMGATIGRYGNRLAQGRFQLGERFVSVPVNNGTNALHGGPIGFDLRNWTPEVLADGVAFTLISEDGDQGFPGRLQVTTSYTLHDNLVSLRYEAITTEATVINLTNHTYFNLSGEGAPTILNDELTVDADYIVAIDEALIPTGELMVIDGSPFDFTTPAIIGSRMSEPHTQLEHASGYDHTFVVRGKPGKLRSAARLHNQESGRTLHVSTTEPGIQVYSGNFLDGSLRGKSGRAYPRHSGLCLETQHFPDSPNQPTFPSTVLQPGESFRSETLWRFQHT